MGIVRRPSVLRWLLVCLLVSYTGFSKLSTIDEADADGTSGPASRTTRVAVMIVGGVRNENGLQVWASIQTNVIAPLQQHYDEVDVFFCIGQSQLDSNLRENVTSAGPVGYNVQFWSYEVGSNEIYVHPQFERMRVCYDSIEDRFGGSFPRYDSIVKTRPDNLWGSPVPLPFSNQHVFDAGAGGSRHEQPNLWTDLVDELRAGEVQNRPRPDDEPTSVQSSCPQSLRLCR